MSSRRSILCFVVFLSAVLSLFLLLLLPIESESKPSISPQSTDDLTDETDIPTGLHPTEPITALVLCKDSTGENTTTILLCSLIPASGKMQILQIPRDTYIRYEETGVKLGTLFAHLKRNATQTNAEDPEGQALSDLRSLLCQAMAIKIDYHLLLNLKTIETAIDKIGGVTMTVKQDMHYSDPDRGLTISIKAGSQTLSGKQSIPFLRSPDGYVAADLARLEMQKDFLRAFLTAVKRPRAVASLVSSLPSLLSGTKSNATLSDFVYYLGLATGLKEDKTQIDTLPGQTVKTSTGTWFFILEREKTTPLLDAIRGEQQPFDPDLVFTDEDDAVIHSIYQTSA